MPIPSRDPIVALGADRSLYVGALPATARHRHGAPVLLVGLSGPIDVHVTGAVPERCRSAIVEADVEHVLDPRGERVAVLYLEPDAPEIHGVRARHLRGAPAAFDVVARAADAAILERRLCRFELETLLGRTGRPGLDGRIARVLTALRSGTPAPDRPAAARDAVLSPSRFNHLFRAQTGVSFRRYRLWTRLRGAVRAAPAVRTLTDAAVDAGFADAAHFTRAFRSMFGLAPSAVLKGLRHVDRLD